ncbi:MAG: metalloregulator ArsR/SmtB family transcription factor [Actinomycetales bacterium]|nr:metalloregulator ArsR/SmtB family transcription factor [Actinomycetales bacterium]
MDVDTNVRPTATGLLPLAEVTAGPACCPSGLSEPIDRDTAEELARLLKAVADPARLQLLSLLRSREDCAACVCDLTEPLGLSQPTVSHHLKVLVEAGILSREKRGYWTWYSIVPTRLGELAAVLA